MTTRVSLELTGKTPLLCHNVELANPLRDESEARTELSAKRKKTRADRMQLSRLEWFGGLYLAPGIPGPAFPTRAIRKSLIEGARLTKNGKDVERALSFDDMYVPLAFEGPRDLDQLYNSEDFVDRSMVVVSAKRILRTRPRFNEWAVVATAWVEEDLINLATLQRVADAAGRSIGIGDNRANTYGRYRAMIRAA